MAHDNDMTFQHALAELFGGDSQTLIAARLRDAGLTIEQTKVSRWLRGVTDPHLAELPVIEDTYDKPRGWLLSRAGYVELPGIDAIKLPDAPAAPLAQRVTELEEQLRELLTLVQAKASGDEAAENAEPAPVVQSSRPGRRARRA